MLVSKVRERVTATAGLPSRSWGVTMRVVALRWVLGPKFMVACIRCYLRLPQTSGWAFHPLKRPRGREWR